MPFVVFRDDARRRIDVTSGSLTFDDFSAIFRLRAGDAQDYNLLLDSSAATATISTEELRTAADKVKQANIREGPRGNLAVIAGDDAVFGLARSYETLCELAGIDTIQVFRDRAAAERWLAERPSTVRSDQRDR